jgi:protein tyrosine phosphatase
VFFSIKLKETREVYHCHYTNWPDFGEPSDKSFLNFLEFCENLDLFNTSQHQQTNASSSKVKITGPPVIHCSAGVGRSGTLVLIDSVLSLFKLFGDDIPMQIIDILSELRRGRMGLVQTHQQLK